MKQLTLILILLISLSITAQDHNRNRIKALKVSFITERLELSEKEAQKFWPIYNDNERNTQQIKHKEIRATRKEIKENINSMSDEQASHLIQKLNNAELRLHQLHVEYSKKLSEIISAKKILKLKVAEADFKRRMLEQLKKRQKERG